METFQKYFKNTSWLFFAKIFSSITSFFTIAIVARYLGPENLGKLEYAQSLVAIISVFSSLGMEQILYRELIDKPNKENELLGTIIYTKIFIGVILFLLTTLISLLYNQDLIYTIIVSITALTLVINPLGTISVYFDSKVKSKYVSIVSIFISILIPFLKIIFILSGLGIIYFSLLLVLESIIYSCALAFIYLKINKKRLKDWSFKFETLRNILHDSWPLFLSGFSGYIFAKIDQVMLMHYSDALSVGLYSSAVKITQIWAFLPGLVIGSLFPAIINSKKTSFSSYANRLKKLTFAVVTLIIIISAPLFFFSKQVLNIIFGNQYLEAAPILQIYLWIGVAITLIVLIQHYLIAENLSKIFLYITLFGAITNVILNIILIPNYGGVGAAISTLMSYASVVIAVLFFKKSRNGIVEILKFKNG
mgnify:CR=1 FL=1